MSDLKGWHKVTVKSLAASSRHSFIDGDWVEAPFITSSGIRLIQTGNIGIGTFIDKNQKFISESSFKELNCKDVFEGDILICRLAEPIGRSCIVPNLHTRAITSVDVCILRVNNEKYDRDFIAHALNQTKFLAACQEQSGGSTRQRISRTNLGTIEIDIVEDKTEQAKIAEVLSTVDKAISETEALIVKQQRIKTGLMQDLLTRGIDENGNLRSEETHQFKDSPLGRIPVEWDIISISKIATDITSGSRWWAKYYSEEGAIFIRIGNLTREHINLRLDSIQYVAPPESAEKNRTLVKEGDLLISVTADLGIIGVIKEEFPEAYINQHIALIRLNKTINPRFVGHYLASLKGKEQFDHFNESGAKAGLNLPTVGKLCITKPNIKEQIQISKLLDLIDHKILESKFDLQKLQRFKTGLMQDLLTGKKRVTPLLENSPIF